MSSRKVKFKESSVIEPCPKCGNKLEFLARSEQVCEDGCEVWIVCKCGHDPFGDGDRLDDVWGGCRDENVLWAINEWNELISEQNPDKKIINE
jgi:predicted RNA-binding Zn-ribbon protein involved in translation (DUF1610 family)